MADSLGGTFQILDESSQEQILDMIDSADPFARFLGARLGTFTSAVQRNSK
ncbi:MAG: hypothetical protein WA364_00505 [Candidatus Nitrosopolaris sp.]